METIQITNQEKLIEVLKQNHIVFAAIFGSRVKGKANERSDYDLLVEFDPKEKVTLAKYLAIKEDIERKIDKEIDLITVYGLGNKSFKQEVLSTMKVIYGRSRARSLAA